MKVLRNNAWTRRGCSLLWDPGALSSFAEPSEVLSLRQFFAMARAWPDDLPSNEGRALVVAGLEGCLDALTPADAEEWVERQLKQRVFAFQDEYQGDAALVFWLPGGRKRISQALASGDYLWSGHGDARFAIGRLLWAGAQSDAERIVIGPIDADADGDAWCGMYHPRIS